MVSDLIEHVMGWQWRVMLKSGKYNLVHELFAKMKINGEALKALTYKVLVRTFWEEGKPNEAVEAVRDTETRGVIGTVSVYYELVRCLCFYGRTQEAVLEVIILAIHIRAVATHFMTVTNGMEIVLPYSAPLLWRHNSIEKMRRLHPTRPLAVAVTGMIMSTMDGGHDHDCVLLFEHSKTLLTPDIGLINAMLKVYGRSDMFLKAKQLFEETRKNITGSTQTQFFPAG